MYKLSALLIITVVVLMSCSYPNSSNAYVIPENSKRVLLISNEDSLSAEENYYDVLLDLKGTFPKEFENVEVVNATTLYLKGRNIKLHNYPALFIIENNQILMHVEGELSQNQIREQLLAGINN